MFILINVIVRITPMTKFLSDIADRIRRLHAREGGGGGGCNLYYP